MRKFITSLTTVATLTLAAVPALGVLQAAHAAEPTTATVSLLGLDLSKPAQAAEFSARVDAAAQDVCGAMARNNAGGDFTMAGCKVAIRQQASAQLTKQQRQGLQMAARATSVSVAAR
ncbi:MAG: UrcA family protein [Caulobacter sp.]|nr:UrcA family protein [Caulobacter sp.]